MMNHLVNHLCHFPMGVGASRLSSSVSEYHDVVEVNIDDLKSDIFTAPNVQVSMSATEWSGNDHSRARSR